MLGASHSELALVGMLFLMVLVAPKIPRIGEWIGARFEPAPTEPPPPPSTPRPPAPPGKSAPPAAASKRPPPGG